MKKSSLVLLFLFVLVVLGLSMVYLLRTTEDVFSLEAAGGVEEGEASLAAPASDRERQDVDAVTNSRENAITAAVRRVSPAVVGINVTEVRTYVDPFYRFFGDDPFMRRFFGDRTYRQEVKGLGSGFIISSDGYIITNDHVAGNAAEITVTMTNGTRLTAELVGSDPVSDIALLKVDARDLPALTLGNSDDIIVGEWAIAFGNPFGLFEINDKPTVTVGVISSTNMNLGRVENRLYRDMIETDAAINRGNSGGPLVNGLGEVIGVNTLIYTGGQSTTFVGYGFAIPINKVKKVVGELRRTGKVERQVVLGFQVQDVDRRIARILGMRRVEGVIVTEIRRGSSAARAGLREGDVILEINGQKVNSEDDVFVLASDAKPEEEWKLTIYRDQTTTAIAFKLERQAR